MKFKKIVTLNSICKIPNGSSGLFGYAEASALASHRSLESEGYTSCNGVVTFEPSTLVYTLCHYPPGGPQRAARKAYIKFLKVHTNPATTHYWVVGGFPTRLTNTSGIPSETSRILIDAGFAAVNVKFTGPRGRACDVYCHSAGLTISTRGPSKTTVISWGMGVSPSAPMTI